MVGCGVLVRRTLGDGRMLYLSAASFVLFEQNLDRGDADSMTKLETHARDRLRSRSPTSNR